MAKESKKQPKRKLAVKKSETLRQRAEKSTTTKPKTRRLRTAGSGALKPIKAAARFGRREFYLPMPDNKAGRFLNKRRSFIPRYFKNSFKELKQVEWPNNKKTRQLTIAVFMFSIFFGVIVAIVDFGLDKLFQELVIK